MQWKPQRILGCSLRQLALALFGASSLLACGTPAVEPPASDIEQFVERTRAYVVLRERAVAGQPAFEETASPGQIRVREQNLASAIRSERAGAKGGDVFGAARVSIAGIVARDWKQRPAKERAALANENQPAPVPAVNQPYPERLPLATFPPSLLGALPELPPELEYRFAGPHLVLRDSEANLVVDVAPDVMPTH